MRARALPTIVSLIALAATSGAASAPDKAPIQPKLGNWEVVQELTPSQVASVADVPARILERMGYDPVAKTVRTTLCLNAQTMSRWEEQDRELRATGKAQCQDPVYTAAGDVMTMTLECTAPVMLRMRTEYRFNGARDAYTYENEVTTRAGGKPRTQRVRGSARRIGDC
jgi:Protein of unknown function (DUF3617)